MSAAINDGGPAFPCEVDGAQPQGRQSGSTSWHDYGMSLRDYFAAKALPAVIVQCAADTRNPAETKPAHFARIAYEVADAMINARWQA